jgi:hypothetical protein
MRTRLRASHASTSHELIALVTDRSGNRIFTQHSLPSAIEKLRPRIISLVGADRADWAISQLLQTPPRVGAGWPRKGARVCR